MGTRSAAVGQGLASIQSAVGTMIAYATQPDNVALDGSGRNSPFTTAMLKHLPTPGLDISVLMRRVRADVVQATGQKQVPWDHSSLMGDVVLVPAALPAAPPALRLPSPRRSRVRARIWPRATRRPATAGAAALGERELRQLQRRARHRAILRELDPRSATRQLLRRAASVRRQRQHPRGSKASRDKASASGSWSSSTASG